MIEVTRLNGTTVLINSDLIETVEETRIQLFLLQQVKSLL